MAHTPTTAMLLTLVFCCLVTRSAGADERVWTGAGADDLWSNPENWQDGLLPTEGDDIGFGSPGTWASGRQSVTIDGPAQAGRLEFVQGDYPWPYLGEAPFRDISILDGADYSLRSEYIDHLGGTYTQSGGTHAVAEDFTYASDEGAFLMTDGVFSVGGTLTVAPVSWGTDNFSITGGQVTAARLQIGMGYPPTSFHIGGTAEVAVTDRLYLHSQYSDHDLSFSRPILMQGADFTYYMDGFDDIPTIPGIGQMHLVFEGGLDDTSTFEARWLDAGRDPYWYGAYEPFGHLQVGGSQPGRVQLARGYVVEPDEWVFNALYVSELTIGPGSVLDLNGHALYQISSFGCVQVLPGRWGEGSVINTPAPGAVLLGLIGLSHAGGRLRRRRAEKGRAV